MIRFPTRRRTPHKYYGWIVGSIWAAMMALTYCVFDLFQGSFSTDNLPRHAIQHGVGGVIVGSALHWWTFRKLRKAHEIGGNDSDQDIPPAA